MDGEQLFRLFKQEGHLDKIKLYHSIIKEQIINDGKSKELRIKYQGKEKRLAICSKLEEDIEEIQGIGDNFLTSIMKHRELVMNDEQHKTTEIRKFIEDILLPARSVTKTTTVTRDPGLFSSTETRVVSITSSLDESKINDFFRLVGYAKRSNIQGNVILLKSEYREHLRADFPDLIQEMETIFGELANETENRTNMESFYTEPEHMTETTYSDDIDELIDQLKKHQGRLVKDQNEFLQILQNITSKAVRIAKLGCLMAMKLVLLTVKAELTLRLHLEASKQKALVEAGIKAICQVQSFYEKKTVKQGFLGIGSGTDINAKPHLETFDANLYRRLTNRYNEIASVPSVDKLLGINN